MHKFLISLLTVLSFSTAFYAIIVFRPNTSPTSSTTSPTKTPLATPVRASQPKPVAPPATPETPITPPSAPVAPEVSVPEDTPPPATTDTTTLPLTNKHIYVSLKEQDLRYYEGDQLIGEFKISSGLPGTPTPPGEYNVIVKRPFVNYFGANYSFPNTKWNLMFKRGNPLNYYIHGAYWHHNFGHPMSHGCVNVSYANMEGLYNWADIGTPITIIAGPWSSN